MKALFLSLAIVFPWGALAAPSLPRNHLPVPIVRQSTEYSCGAAALLSVKAGCREALSPLGSELARVTLERYGVRYHFSKVVARIVTPEGRVCPMEELSTGKDPDEFYGAVRQTGRPEAC